MQVRKKALMWKVAVAAAGVALAIVAFDVVHLAAGPKTKFNKVISIGDSAPDWADLPGTDGKRHSLADYREAQAMVVVFICNHCPVAKMYEDRLIEFSRKYKNKVQVLAICVSHNDADKLEKMKARASEKGFPFPYLYDDSQKSARNLGATATPHFFLLDSQRKIAYMGAFDDSRDPENVEKHYLVDAVDAVLAGEEPRIKESLQRGCLIDYEF